MSQVDKYKLKMLDESIYMLVVFVNLTESDYGVLLDLRHDKIDLITDENIYAATIRDKRKWEPEIEALYEELKLMSDFEIRQMIQTKLSMNKFNL